MKAELSKSGEYVKFLMESGRDLVMGSMKEAEAEEIIKNVDVSRSEYTAFPIKAGLFYFKGKLAEDVSSDTAAQKKGKKK